VSGALAAFCEHSPSRLFGRIGHNRHQAQTLATLRDTLLPRLISGQLRLPAAETLLAEFAA
jgi:type I restriction enzyme S subunit